MPNWTTNQLTLRGEQTQLECFKDALDGENGVVDFNRIRPMPGELEIESGSRTNLGMACFRRTEFAYYHNIPWFKERYPGVDSPAKLRAVLGETEPATVEIGRQALANIRQYGVPTWYEWCNREWGTKWNAYEPSAEVWDETLQYSFDTAWDAPRPLVEPIVELAHSFELTVVWLADHEDGGPEQLYEDRLETRAA